VSNVQLDKAKWTFLYYRMLCDQTLCQIWPKSNNLRRSYRWFSTASVCATCSLFLAIHAGVSARVHNRISIVCSVRCANYWSVLSAPLRPDVMR